jgi:hypothetical protein
MRRPFLGFALGILFGGHFPPAQLRNVFAPSQSVTVVTAATPNSFPLPAAAATNAVCIVTRNVAQSPGIDYDITGGAVVFLTPPLAGDVVQLNCW